MTGVVLLLAALALGQGPPPGELGEAIEAARARAERGSAPGPAEVERLRGLAAEAGGPLASDLERTLREGGERPRELGAGLARLGRRVAAVRAESTGGRAAPGGREALGRVLARREFRSSSRPPAGKRGDGDAPGWWERILERLDEWLERARRQESKDRSRGLPFGVGAAPVAFAAAGLVLGLGVIAARRWIRDREAPRKTRASPARGAAAAGQEALWRDPEEWLRLAEERLGLGDVTGAVRALYLALLVALHRAGAIEVRASRTNWEHARRLAARLPEVAPAFRDLTALFDRAVYGGRQVAPADYDAARVLAGEVRGVAEARVDTAVAGAGRT